MKASLSLLFSGILVSACSGGPPPSPSDPSKPTTSAAAGSAAPAASAQPAERPFAASGAQASELIGEVLDKRSPQMQKCIAEHRARKNLPHERVEISVGIDQNGLLIGATLKKGKADPALDQCIQAALAGAPFPKSHAGIITMTKSYEDIVQ